MVNAAGCGSAMKDYGHLLRDDPEWAASAEAFAAKVRDVDRAAGRGRAACRAHARADRQVAYHDACHLAHAQGVRAQPRELLRGIPGSSWSSPAAGRSAAARPASTTCSSPSRRPSSAAARSTNLLATGATAIAAANPGCALQIAAHAERRASRSPCITRSSCWRIRSIPGRSCGRPPTAGRPLEDILTDARWRSSPSSTASSTPRRAARRPPRAPGRARRRASCSTSCRRPARSARATGRSPRRRRPPGPPRRDHRPDRPQDGHQRPQLRRQRLHGRLRGRELADLGEHGRRPAQPARRDRRHDRVHRRGRQASTASTRRPRRCSSARAAGTCPSATC